VQYYVGEFGLDIRVAALLAACFSLPGGVLRAIGGVLSDKFGAHAVTWWVMWVSWIALFILSYPQTDMTIQTMNAPSHAASTASVSEGSTHRITMRPASSMGWKIMRTP